MKPVLLAVLLGLAGGMVLADQPVQDASSAAAAPGQKTGKERLSGKAADQQRVNDCKVPHEKRGASKRPTACTHRKTAH